MIVAAASRLSRQNLNTASDPLVSVLALFSGGLFHEVAEWLPSHRRFVRLSIPKREGDWGGRERKKRKRLKPRVGGRKEEGSFSLLVILRNTPELRRPILGQEPISEPVLLGLW